MASSNQQSGDDFSPIGDRLCREEWANKVVASRKQALRLKVEMELAFRPIRKMRSARPEPGSHQNPVTPAKPAPGTEQGAGAYGIHRSGLRREREGGRIFSGD
jgi:hypothetical protein